MNADLTFNSVVFKKTFDERDLSERQSIARGINTPDDLVIKTQAYVDSATKVAGRRFQGRVTRVAIDANGQPYNTEIYYIANIPQLASGTDLSTVTATFKALVADADFMTNVFNNEK